MNAAKVLVDRFVSYFDESYRQLAYYAALPLLLTPELLNFLRGRFLRGQVPWVAEADLLLSDLCRQVGYEQYALKPAVRAYLLSEMEETIGRDAMQNVARLLIQYMQYLEKLDVRHRREERQAQQWAAMVYLDDNREQAVQEMKSALQQQMTPAGGSLLSHLEADRLSRLVASLAPELGAHQELVDFAVDVNRLLHDRVEETAAPPQPDYAQKAATPDVPDFIQSTTPVPPPAETDPRKVLDMLNQFFNEDELRELAFDLAVDYEQLPPGGKKDKARELILLISRRNQLDALVAAIVAHRPNMTRGSFLEDAPAVPATEEDVGETAVDETILTQTLINLFDESELRDLCFDLTIDYNGLPPGDRQAKAQALVTYFARRRQLNILVDAIREARPFISLELLSPNQEVRESAAQSIPPTTPIDRRKLTRVLLEQFNEEELRDLCFELVLDYENLAGSGKSVKVRSLIQYLQRRNRLPELLDLLKKVRPRIDFDDLITTKEEDVGAAFQAAQKGAQSKSDTLTTGRGLSALIRLMQQPALRSAIASFQTDFAAASEQIKQLYAYKVVHDLLQELENRYLLIMNDLRQLPKDDLAWDSIALNEPDLHMKISELIEYVQNTSLLADEMRWIEQLEKGRNKLQDAVEAFDFTQLQSSMRLLDRVLNRQMSRINAQIVATAGTIRLDTLNEAIATITKALLVDGKAPEDLVNQIEQGGVALADLSTHLKDLVHRHNAWQEVDDELRRVEASIDFSIEDLEDAWFDLDPMLRESINQSEEAWALSLQKVLVEMNEALEGETAVATRRLFHRLRSQVRRRFRQVDLELLELSRRLQSIAESLDVLLRQFN